MTVEAQAIGSLAFICPLHLFYFKFPSVRVVLDGSGDIQRFSQCLLVGTTHLGTATQRPIKAHTVCLPLKPTGAELWRRMGNWSRRMRNGR